MATGEQWPDQKNEKKEEKPLNGIFLFLHSYAFTWGGSASVILPLFSIHVLCD